MCSNIVFLVGMRKTTQAKWKCASEIFCWATEESGRKQRLTDTSAATQQV